MFLSCGHVNEENGLPWLMSHTKQDFDVVGLKTLLRLKSCAWNDPNSTLSILLYSYFFSFFQHYILFIT